MIAQSLLFFFLAVAFAIPDVAFPFNSQVPPVARVGQSFEFTFSATTFRPNGEQFQYTLAGAPAWLSLDSTSRTLSGTPGNIDVGSPTFIITASDGSGINTMQATLVVVAFEAPEIGASITDALDNAGNMCGPSSVTFAPKTPFTFDFPSNMFAETGKQISYYATLSDHTPLPGWLIFDAQSLHFSGTTPPINSSPQGFEILIIASDVVGFAGAWVPFTIVVSDHQFYFKQAERIVNIAPNAEVNLSDLRSQLLLNEVPVRDGNLLSSTATIPRWLSFSQGSFDVTGVPPPGTKTENISVSAQDIFGDVANVTLHLVISGLIVAEVGTLNATIGREFEYTLEKSMFAQNDLGISVDLGSASSWLHFDPTSMTISGTVPTSLPSQLITGEINVVTSNGSRKDSQTFTINVKAANTTASATATRSLNSTAASATGGVLSATGPSSKTHASRRLGMIVGIVVAIILAIIGIVFTLIWRRSPHKGLHRTSSAVKKTISRPMATDNDPWTTEMEREYVDLEKGSNEFERTPDDPPQITLHLSPEKPAPCSSQLASATISPVKADRNSVVRSVKNRNSVASSTINDGDALILDNINRTSWGYLGASTHKPHDSMRLATQMARASRQLDENSPTGNRRASRHLSKSRTTSTSGYRSGSSRTTSTGLPVNLRLTDLGHGRNLPGSNRNSMLQVLQIQQQQRLPSYLESYSTRSTSVISSFPPPPGSVRLSQQSSQFGSQRRSMRDSMLRDPRRASAQRPLSRRGQRPAFFSGGPSNRRSSSSRHRSTILGLHTIHGSPDLGFESPAAESSEALAPVTTNATKAVGESPKPEPQQPRLGRNPTQTSSRTAKTWQTTTTTTTNTASGSDASVEAQLPDPPRNSLHTYKRWSSDLRSSRFSRSLSDYTTSGADRTTTDIRGSVRFASADETSVSSTEEVDEDGDTRMSSSFYSQSSVAVVSPDRPPTRGKIPTGGVRIPPFASPSSLTTTPIMERPHPRASFRNGGLGSSAIRAPLRKVRDGENRFSGNGFSSGMGREEGYVSGLFEEGHAKGQDGKVERSRLRSTKGKKPGSVKGMEKIEREGRSGTGDKAFL
jgi:hypothetical protein